VAKGKKTGGRVAGTPNKDNQSIMDKLAELDCDPLKGVTIIAEESMEAKDYAMAFQCFKELGQYVAPKRKSIEVNTHVSFEQSLHDLSDDELDATLKGYNLDATRV